MNTGTCSTCTGNRINPPFCTCPDGSFEDNASVICLTCPNYCVTCSAATICLSCPSDRNGPDGNF